MQILTYFSNLVKKHQKCSDPTPAESTTTSHKLLKLLNPALTSKEIIEHIEKNYDTINSNMSSKQSSNKSCQCQHRNLIVVIQPRTKHHTKRVPVTRGNHSHVAKSQPCTKQRKTLKHNRKIKNSCHREVNSTEELSHKRVKNFRIDRSNPFSGFDFEMKSKKNLHSTLKQENSYEKDRVRRINSVKLVRGQPLTSTFRVDFTSTPIKTSPKTSTPRAGPIRI